MGSKTEEAGVASRICAARVLSAVYGGRSLTEALKMPCVVGMDQPFIQALCYGVLRDYPRHERLASLLLQKPLKPSEQELAALLHSALYQIDRMRVPPHAAVNESVQAARKMGKGWASGLVNAVLRRYLREQVKLNEKVQSDSEVNHALPAWLLARLRNAWPEQWREISDALRLHAPLTLRVNQLKIDRDSYSQRLLRLGLASNPHPFAPDALVLDQPVSVDRLPGFAEGMVSVQDAGAQLAAALLASHAGERVLDACAAPGGKSGHLIELAEGGLDLWAVDVDKKRMKRVDENLLRLGLKATCHVGDATQPSGPWAEGHYQKILLDAPCSATGVIRRHPDIKLLRRDDDLVELTKTQQSALCALWPLLAPGGLMLYATCSLLPEENEIQLETFMAGHADAMEMPIMADWGVPRSIGRQTLPGEAGMDGFYYACLRKREGVTGEP